MTGRIVIVALLAFTAVFAAALWWFQTRAYYERIAGLPSVMVQGQAIAVEDYDGIDAATSPLKMRACLRLDPGALADVPVATDATPLTPPGWFDCFDVGRLTGDLAAGRATAYVAADETPEGAVDYAIIRYLAVYPDGRAFMWRQMNDAAGTS